jgi:hypothetical protein
MLREETMKGIVCICKWRRSRRGVFVLEREWRRENLIVNGALALIAELVGGTTGGNFISAVGFGSGTAAPSVTDTDITAPAYYKALSAPTFPQSGQCQFSWEIVGSTDTGAVGLTIQELGFYANTGTVALPISRASGDGAPSMTLCAHVSEFVGAIAAGGSYTGTWTFVA